MRGKRLPVAAFCPAVRITPACAGKTSCEISRLERYKDHPRVCGENRRPRHLRESSRGSPPRVRGKPRCCIEGFIIQRITPACAGKTATGHAIPCRGWDHPRVCGENVYIVHIVPCDKGSPPRVRGKPAHSPRLAERRRITPACAGKTIHRLGVDAYFEDHPRVCGENCRTGRHL